MLGTLKDRFNQIRRWVVEQVLWAEKDLDGKTGAEKRAIVVAKLDDMVKLPFWLEWVDGLVIGWLVDLACEKLNWLSGYDFSKVELDEQQTDELAEILDAPVAKAASVAATGATVDERLEQLYAEYGIKQGDKPVEDNDANWKKSINFVMKWEGGANFSVKKGQIVLKNSAKNDAGGPTCCGITVPVLKAAYASGVVEHGDITALTRDDAEKIYRKNYWERYGWDKLSFPACLCCMDISVNHGGFAWILQRACVDCGQTLKIDGKFGPQTYQCAAACEPLELARAIVEQRKAYYQKIVKSNQKQMVFLKGWMNRTNDMAKVSGV